MDSHDFIIVGAGSAGCVMANRLSADPRNRVLLIEEGGVDKSWLVRTPKGFGKLLEDPRHASYAMTTHDRGGGAPEIWIRGKMIGGSSSVNGMVWVRGQQEDYDHFGELGLRGWNWSDVAPYFKRLEDHALGEDDLRGVGGPVAVTTHALATPLSEAIIGAGQTIGLERKKDMNRLDQEGIGYLQVNIDKKGQRVSAARAFLDPARRRPNLRIVTGTRVDRVIFEGKRAAGVAGTRAGQPVQYHADGEVIICAGGIYSPRLLQLSGIGQAAHLGSLGIAVIHDSPTVGQNLREHWLLALQYRLRDGRYSHNAEYSGLNLFKNVLQYWLFRNGIFACGPYEVGGFARTRPGLNRPNVQLMYGPFSLNRRGKGFEREPGIQVFGYPLRPESRGSIEITASDPNAPLKISPNYLTSPADRADSVGATRLIREMMKSPAVMPFIAGETDDTAQAQTDDEILELFRRYGQAGFHATSACAMGANDGAALDDRIRVRGVEGLRVMDTSVFPEMISGNTNAPVMALAWRAADLILEDAR